MKNKLKNQAAVELGRLGGQKKSELYDHEHYVKIGKLGGRPKITKEEDGQTNLDDETLDK